MGGLKSAIAIYNNNHNSQFSFLFSFFLSQKHLATFMSSVFNQIREIGHNKGQTIYLAIGFIK